MRVYIMCSGKETLGCLHFTSNPSSRRHCLCSSISFWHSESSSPLWTMHSSRAVFVSGQQQQMGLPVLIPSFCFGFVCREKSRGNGWWSTVGQRLLYTSQHHPILADIAKRFTIPPPQIVVLMIPGPSFRGLCPYV